MENYIRFDWAMNRLLRDKANHEVLEGFMESLLGEKFTIVDFLESEGNQKNKNDKFNRVDILVKNSKEELYIFEIQNEREYTYFQRILYGTSKVITEYINLGDDFKKVRKVYSVSIVYFDLGQGKDYVYHGKTEFRGVNDSNDILMLSKQQNKLFFGDQEKLKSAGAIFPEYYILRVNNFDKVSATPLDEWIYFLKTSMVTPESTAPGLDKVRECMKVDNLSKADREDYNYHLEMLRDQRSMLQSGIMDGMAKGREEGMAEGLVKGRAEGLVKGREEGREEGMAESLVKGREEGLTEGLAKGRVKEKEMTIERMLNKGFSVEEICECVVCSVEEVLKLKNLKRQ